MTTVVLVNAATFLLAAIVIGLMRTPATPPQIAHHAAQRRDGQVSSFLSEWIAGLRLIHTSRLLVTLFSIMGIAILADSILSALLVPFVDAVANQGVQAVGFIFSVVVSPAFSAASWFRCWHALWRPGRYSV